MVIVFSFGTLTVWEASVHNFFKVYTHSTSFVVKFVLFFIVWPNHFEHNERILYFLLKLWRTYVKYIKCILMKREVEPFLARINIINNKFQFTVEKQEYGVFFLTGFELLIAWLPVRGFWRNSSQSTHQSLELMTITNFALLWGNCERHGAKRNELAVENSFSQLCTGFQIT